MGPAVSGMEYPQQKGERRGLSEVRDSPAAGAIEGKKAEAAANRRGFAGWRVNRHEQGIRVSEVEQLKKRIDDSGQSGVETAHIRDDYEPIGDTMIRDLCASGAYITRKVPPGMYDQKWKIFKKGAEPY